MKTKRMIAFILALVLVLPGISGRSLAASDKIITSPTGYTSADQVDYYKSGSYVANWGARGENATFQTTYSSAYYSGSYTYEKLAANAGGTTQSNAKDSALYAALKSMMNAKNKHTNSYEETKKLFKLTDCLKNDTAHISCFYTGRQLNGAWDSAKTWNREHTWPNSKGLGGSDENDIMMLRPTWVSANSSRGNTAYGESGSYYDPGVSVRGDCARIVLYVYVRWGNTGKMWGTSGVMENMNVLLKWMEEDPVDTWELGRNDAVQSITGVRNVFVDYPELAFQLFGKPVPEDMSTPSNGQISPVDPTQPTTPSEPTEPTKPSEPDPTEPTDPEDMAGIVDAAYALEPGEKLSGTKTLTGRVTEIVDAFNPNFNNVTVNIVVEGREDKPIQCFRMIGKEKNSALPFNAADVKVGDIITVEGTLQNYQGKFIEFDASCKLMNLQTGVVYGDVDGDGDINLKDVNRLRAALAEGDLSTLGAGADVNGDGAVNLKDVNLLRNYLAGSVTNLGPQK